MSVWEELVGQPYAVNTLTQAITHPESMTHAWLITGPPGSGRSVAARAFAAALQCLNGGCGHCASCTTVLKGQHPDVTVVATDKVTIAIDDVRGLISEATRSPSQGRWRIIIIEDADRMMERTTNVLLKAIEEPPPRTIWLLCAPSPQDVMVTIRSRCRNLALRIPPIDDVAQLLITRDGIDPATAHASAAAAQSHIGMARRYATHPETRQRRTHVLALTARISTVADAIYAAAELLDTAQHDAQQATAERDAQEKEELLRTLGASEARTLPPALRSHIKTLEDDQKRRATRHQRDVLDRCMTDIISLYRDILLTQTGATATPINTDLTTTIDDIAHRTTPEHTLTAIDAIQRARRRLAANVAPLLVLEAMFLDIRTPTTHARRTA